MKQHAESTTIDTRNPSKHSFIWIISLFLSVSSIAVGIYFVYCSSDFKFDSSFLGSLFSLAGVFIFAATLIYQVFEFRLQIIELKKSVAAQTKTSLALDDQRNIMLEQMNDAYIMGIIEGYNSYRELISTKSMIEEVNRILFEPDISHMLRISDRQQLHVNLDSFISAILTKAKVLFSNNKSITSFTHQFWNIIREIERAKTDAKKQQFYLSYFICQLSIEEQSVLFLTEILDLGGSLDELYFLNQPTLQSFLGHASKLPNSGFLVLDAYEYSYEKFKEKMERNKETRWHG